MEPLKQTVAIALEEPTQVASARRAVRELAERVGMAEEAIARAELVAVEMAGNVLCHAGRGRLFVTVSPELTTPGSQLACGLQIVGIDEGPGIASVAEAMGDGYTTSTTPGYGLGAMKRLSEGFDLYTAQGKGTVVSATLGGPEERMSRAGRTLGVISTSLDADPLNGDSWAVHRLRGRTVYLMVDGLGHGLHASEAARMAIGIAERVFAADPAQGLEALIHQMHVPMRATRGAAVLLVAVEDGVITHCGVGNISAAVQAPGGRGRGLISSNGTVGHQMRGLKQFQMPCEPGSLLVMHTDGLSTRWRMTEYPGLESCAAATIAGVLYRDAARGRDDATVLVAHLEQDTARAHYG